mmetsp:Transcript_66540/g.172590  ORF Transcript_66540/g.172590 Transcript_66540/m.172590 type:complete len:203 (-) Transcript_66540:497-1105(-)
MTPVLVVSATTSWVGGFSTSWTCRSLELMPSKPLKVCLKSLPAVVAGLQSCTAMRTMMRAVCNRGTRALYFTLYASVPESRLSCVVVLSSTVKLAKLLVLMPNPAAKAFRKATSRSSLVMFSIWTATSTVADTCCRSSTTFAVETLPHTPQLILQLSNNSFTAATLYPTAPEQLSPCQSSHDKPLTSSKVAESSQKSSREVP